MRAELCPTIRWWPTKQADLWDAGAMRSSGYVRPVQFSRLVGRGTVRDIPSFQFLLTEKVDELCFA